MHILKRLMLIHCVVIAFLCKAETLQFSKQLLDLANSSNNEEGVLYSSKPPSIDYSIPVTPKRFSGYPVNFNEQPSIFSYKNAHKAINLFAISYAMVRTHNKYQCVYYNAGSKDSGFIGKIISKIIDIVSPQLVIDLGKNGLFLLESMNIVAETLVLKTALKLILYTGQADIIDTAPEEDIILI